MPYRGYYINLDRSPERRAFMETQLAGLDPPARYQRFAAVDGIPEGVAAGALTAAQIGCLASHHRVLGLHLDGATHLHIVEDDTTLAKRTVQFIEQIIGSGMLDEYDILFTASFLPHDFYSYREGRTALRDKVRRAADGTATEIEFVCIPFVAGTASYLVNRRSIRLVHDVIGDDLAGEPRNPVDILIRDAAHLGRLRAGCLFPFIASVVPGRFDSTIPHEDDKQLSVLAMDLLRHSFFVECDARTTLELANRVLSDPNADLHNRLHAHIAGFVSSDGYHPF